MTATRPEELHEVLRRAGPSPSAAWRTHLRTALDDLDGDATTALRSILTDDADDADDTGRRDIRRGAAFGLAEVDPDPVPTLTAAARRYSGTVGSSATTPGIKVARACLRALALTGPDAAAPLDCLRRSLVNRALVDEVDEALDRLAAEQHRPPHDLVETTVPTFGRPTLNDEPGAPRARLGEPLTPFLASERVRLEELLGTGRTWTVPDWQARYRDHPITGLVARSLIWAVSGPGGRTLASVAKGALVDVTGITVDIDPEASSITLWHPADDPPETAAAWQDRLAVIALTPAFAQVDRDCFRVLEEEQERRCSTRFSGEEVAYAQAATILRRRGWAVRALGYWDGGGESVAHKPFLDGAMMATVFHDRVDEGETGHLTRHDRPDRARLDQVRFSRRSTDRWRSVAMGETPPAVFSETMRDLALVTAKAGMGRPSDPMPDPTPRRHPLWLPRSLR